MKEPIRLSNNRKNAIAVRLGEKRILRKVHTLTQDLLTTLQPAAVATTAPAVTTDKKQKRGRDSEEGANQKRARR